MQERLSRRVSRRRRRVFTVSGPEQLETRQLLTNIISGSVFHDTNNDGVRDEGETGIAGVLITLTGTTDEGDQVTRRYLTKVDGKFSLEDLDAGTYEITEEQPAAIADGLDRTDAEGPVRSNDRYSKIVLTDDTEVLGLNFGEGTIEAQHVSPIWLLASSSRESFQREMRATLEEDAGNAEVADAIRDGETELDADFELNEAPRANGESYDAVSGTTLSASAADGVLNNDSDPEGDDVTAVLVDEAEHGTVSLQPDGSFSYDADPGFIGPDSFTYSANDGFKNSAPATVNIEVESPNIFSVSEAAVENELVGLVEPLTDLGDSVIFSLADATVDERIRLVPDDRMVGLPESPVVLIEYVDFACGACKAFHEGFAKDFYTDFAGDLLVVYRYFPRLDSTHAQEAAIAVEAAARQGFLEPMMDELFANQAEWRAAASGDAANALFESYIEQNIPGIDLPQYRAAVANPDVAARVVRDETIAGELNLPGTPAFYLQGQRVDQGIDPNDLRLDIVQAVQAAEDARFKINRFSQDSALAGELLVFNGDAITTDASPIDLEIEARSNTGSEIISVTVNVTEEP